MLTYTKGMRVGNLVLDEELPSDEYRRKRWRCKCDCGGEICYKSTDTLTNSDESMFAKCADMVHMKKTRAAAGFVDGTQISKLKSAKPSKVNQCGVRGVSYHHQNNDLWHAQIGFKGQKSVWDIIINSPML